MRDAAGRSEVRAERGGVVAKGLIIAGVDVVSPVPRCQGWGSRLIGYRRRRALCALSRSFQFPRRSVRTRGCSPSAKSTSIERPEPTQSRQRRLLLRMIGCHLKAPVRRTLLRIREFSEALILPPSWGNSLRVSAAHYPRSRSAMARSATCGEPRGSGAEVRAPHCVHGPIADWPFVPCGTSSYYVGTSVDRRKEAT